MSKITLTLDPQQAWFLTQLLENVLTQEEEEHDHLFFTTDENDELTFDDEFKTSIIEVDGLLLKARGL